jgi:hypothetical protein
LAKTIKDDEDAVETEDDKDSTDPVKIMQKCKYKNCTVRLDKAAPQPKN